MLLLLLGPARKLKYLTVTAFSKCECLPFDPCWIGLPSIPALVAFYHACLGYPVKDSRLEAVNTGNCDTFAGLTYLNMACYCPIADKTILRHLAQMQQMSDCPNQPGQLPAPVRPQLARTQRRRSMHHGRCFSMSTQSANSIQMTQEGSQYVCTRAINMTWLLTTRMGTSFYNKLFGRKQIITKFLLLIPSWHGWKLIGFLLISISEITRPVQTSSKSSQSCGKQSSNLFLETCTGGTKPSWWYGTSKTTSSLFLPVLTPPFHSTFGISYCPQPNWLLIYCNKQQLTQRSPLGNTSMVPLTSIWLIWSQWAAGFLSTPNLPHASHGTTEPNKVSTWPCIGPLLVLQTCEIVDKTEGHLRHGGIQAYISANSGSIGGWQDHQRPPSDDRCITKHTHPNIQ